MIKFKGLENIDYTNYNSHKNQNLKTIRKQCYW